jgi:hypothetical protein
VTAYHVTYFISCGSTSLALAVVKIWQRMMDEIALAGMPREEITVYLKQMRALDLHLGTITHLESTNVH